MERANGSVQLHADMQPARPLDKRVAQHTHPSVHGYCTVRWFRMMTCAVASLLFLCVVSPVAGWKNGRALTPPLGFSTWNWKQTCTTSEMLKPVVEALVSRGLVEAGCVFALFFHLSLSISLSFSLSLSLFLSLFPSHDRAYCNEYEPRCLHLPPSASCCLYDLHSNTHPTVSINCWVCVHNRLALHDRQIHDVHG